MIVLASAKIFSLFSHCVALLEFSRIFWLSTILFFEGISSVPEDFNRLQNDSRLSGLVELTPLSILTSRLKLHDAERNTISAQPRYNEEFEPILIVKRLLPHFQAATPSFVWN